jgi:hypothetical protein
MRVRASTIYRAVAYLAVFLASSRRRVSITTLASNQFDLATIHLGQMHNSYNDHSWMRPEARPNSCLVVESPFLDRYLPAGRGIRSRRTISAPSSSYRDRPFKL